MIVPIYTHPPFAWWKLRQWVGGVGSGLSNFSVLKKVESIWTMVTLELCKEFSGCEWEKQPNHKGQWLLVASVGMSVYIRTKWWCFFVYSNIFGTLNCDEMWDLRCFFQVCNENKHGFLVGWFNRTAQASLKICFSKGKPFNPWHYMTWVGELLFTQIYVRTSTSLEVKNDTGKT